MEEYGERVRDVLEKLIEENPEHSKVHQRISERLNACGWKDEVRLECNKIIRKNGLEIANDVPELVQEITPFARSKVPMELKKELVSMLKDALLKELEGTKLNPK